MNKVNNLLQKEMDRKEFLKTIGIFLLVITGIIGTISSLKDHGFVSSSKKNLAKGFGRGPYGV